MAQAKIKTNDGEKYKHLISELLKYNACNAIDINKHQWKLAHRYEHSSNIRFNTADLSTPSTEYGVRKSALC